jgi:hypothetical protein
VLAAARAGGGDSRSLVCVLSSAQYVPRPQSSRGIPAALSWIRVCRMACLAVAPSDLALWREVSLTCLFAVHAASQVNVEINERNRC